MSNPVTPTTAPSPGPAPAPAVTARSLADDLRSRTPEQLTELLLSRSDLAHPPPTDTTDLALRAGSAASVGRALDRLDAGALAVLEVLAASDEPCSAAEAAAGIAGADAERVTGIVDELRRQALLWGPGERIHLVRSVRLAFGAHPAALGPPMAAARRPVAALVADPAALRTLAATAPEDSLELLRRMTWFEPVVAPSRRGRLARGAGDHPAAGARPGRAAAGDLDHPARRRDPA